MSTTEEEDFVRKALARVEKAEKFSRFKQIAMSCILLMFAFWFAFKPSGPEMRVESVVIMGIAAICGTCTAKIFTLVNKNTKDILLAIADLRTDSGTGALLHPEHGAGKVADG